MEKPNHILQAEEEVGVPFEEWSKEEQAFHWYEQVEQRGIDDKAVDGLFEGINDCMNEAEVPSEVWSDVFTLINEDYTVRRN